MSTLILVALLASAFALQLGLDVRSIARLAHGRRWSSARVTWTPWPRGAALHSRWERSYWLRYHDEQGRAQRRLCWVGPAGIELEPIVPDARERGAARPHLRRARFLIATICIGTFLGAALGIAGAFALYPGSNIAPAYGVIWGTPLGLVAGVLFGALCRR